MIKKIFEHILFHHIGFNFENFQSRTEKSKVLFLIKNLLKKQKSKTLAFYRFKIFFILKSDNLNISLIVIDINLPRTYKIK